MPWTKISEKLPPKGIYFWVRGSTIFNGITIGKIDNDDQLSHWFGSEIICGFRQEDEWQPVKEPDND